MRLVLNKESVRVFPAAGSHVGKAGALWEKAELAKAVSIV